MGENHRHTPVEEQRIREAALDATIEASFPASDPPSSLPNPHDRDALMGEPDDESTRRSRGTGDHARTESDGAGSRRTVGDAGEAGRAVRDGG